MTALRKRLTQLVSDLLGQDLSLQHTIFLFGGLAGIAASAFGAISNYIMGLPLLAVFIPGANFVVGTACVVYSAVTKKWRGAAIVLFAFATFVLFPCLWFTTGGTMSSSLPLIIGLGVVLAIVFQGSSRRFFFYLTLLMYSSFILIELYFPGNFIPYPDREAWYIDVLFGFVISFLASGGLAYFTCNRYNAAKRESEMLLQQLERNAITDSLTGVFNRWHLMARLDEEMRRAFDEGNPLSLCIIDIDYFKNVNDTYGHVYGDEVLIEITATIAKCLGESEIFGRYGGEEFVIVLVNSNLETAHKIANEFCDAVRQISWPHEPITISCGISEYAKGMSYSKFLENADTKLYDAKNSGRDCVK